MKRLAFTALCALALAEAAFAQGTLNWNAFIPTVITAETNASVISPFFGGSGIGGVSGPIAPASSGQKFYFELLYNTSFNGSPIAQPTTFSQLASQWIDTGLTASNSNFAGRLSPLNPDLAATVPGWVGGIGTSGGTTNNIMLVGWSANLGNTWPAVLNTLMNWNYPIPENAFFGVSATGYIVPNTGSPGASVFGSSPTVNGLPIYSLNMQLYVIPIPEPGTLALVGLGGLALLWFHRRKSS